MKETKNILIVIGIITIFLTGCQKTENYKTMEASQNEMFPIYDEKSDELNAEESDLMSLNETLSSLYTIQEVKIEEIENPTGICCRDNDILVTDGKSDSIYSIDLDGELLGTFGKTGNGPGEFINPAAITIYQNNIYVLDRGNNRIQILNQDLEYVGEVALKDTSKADPHYEPNMVAVNEKGIYVSGYSLENPMIDVYSNDSVSEIGKNFAGSLHTYNNEVYAIPAMVRTYSEESDTFGLTSAGPSGLYVIKENELKKSNELPKGFFISDFLINNEELVCISLSGGAVYSLDKDGKYSYTIAQIEELVDEEYPKISMTTTGDYYIAAPYCGKIFYLYKAH